MRVRLAAPALAFLALGCPIGPRYHRPDVSPPAQYRPPPAVEDSLRPVFDSLAASRDSLAKGGAGDTIAPPPPGEKSGPRTGDTGAGRSYDLRLDSASMAWFDLFQDTALTSLVREAVQDNRDVRTAVAAIEEFRADVGVARAPIFPQVNITGQGGREKLALGTFKLPAFELYTATANLSWELDFWGRIRRATSAARDDLLAQEESRRAVVLDLVSSVVTTYLQLRELDLALEISRRTLVSRQQTLRLASDRLNHGLISELDVRQFEADVADPAARVADFERQVVQQENALSVLAGRQPGPIPRGLPLSEIIARTNVPTGVPSVVLERRPDVRQSEAQLAAATERVGSATASRLPTFTVTGQYGYQGTLFPELFRTPENETYQIFGGVSIPIFTGGQLYNQERVARARRDQARYRYEQTVLTALREVENALAGVRSDRDQVIANQTQVNALRRALQLANDRYTSGVASYLDLLDAERSLFTAELTLVQTEEQQLADVVELFRATGGGAPVPVPSRGP
jgi:outer membrane protein, multidrug efflux system